MRALLVAVLIAAAAWSGYWFVGAQVMERTANGWFTQQTARGLVAEREALAVTGFPNRFDMTVTSPRFEDPDTGLGWTAPFLQVFMMSWKPWHIIAALPQEQTLDLLGQNVTITSTRLQASVVAVPGTDLALDRITLVGDGVALQSSLGWTLSATSARLATRRAPDSATAHELGLELTTLTPDATFRMALQQGSTLPEVIDLLRIDAVADLTAPLDRHVQTSMPQLEKLTLREGLLRWGDLVISAAGDVVPNSDGQAEGRIDIRVEQWRQLVPVLVAAGLITADAAPTVTRALELLAQQGDDPTVLTVPLAFQQGRMSLGPLPLGPAPFLN
jgi:hypothetical protein